MERYLIIVFLLLLLSVAQGLTLKPVKNLNAFSAQFGDIDYPGDFAKSMKSGLTTHLFIDINLLQGDRSLNHFPYEVRAFYDLWDEVYNVTLFRGGTEIQKYKLKEEAEMMKWFKSLLLPQVSGLEHLGPKESLKLEANMILNPIDREKVEKIQKWVAENSVSGTNPSTSSAGAAATTRGGRLNSMFSAIFNEYTKGEQEIGLWRRHVASEAFQLDGVKP